VYFIIVIISKVCKIQISKTFIIPKESVFPFLNTKYLLILRKTKIKSYKSTIKVVRLSSWSQSESSLINYWEIIHKGYSNQKH